MPKQIVAGQKASGRDSRAKKDAVASTNKQQQPLQSQYSALIGKESVHKKRKTRQSSASTPTHDQQESVGRPPTKLSLIQPHQLAQQTTNGVRSNLLLDENDVPTDNTESFRRGEQSRPAAAGQEVREDGDKRVLRSQGSTRGASELALFFPDYEESVFGMESSDILTVDSVLYLTDDKTFEDSHKLPIRDRQPVNAKPAPTIHALEASSSNSKSGPAMNSPSLPTEDILDLSGYEPEARHFRADPLDDGVYLLAHKRGERHEKKLRNMEKEKAMHEKVQLHRLYDELRGPEWLKTMGISGITDTEKKSFEPKRDQYVIKVKSLLGKFDEWRDKEKDMQLKRQLAAAKVAAEEEAEEEDENELKEEDGVGQEEEEEVDGGMREPPVHGKRKRKGRQIGPDESALQLLKEASLAHLSQKKIRLHNPEPADKAEAEVVFTSFFTKPHERNACLSRHRHGRRMIAFGQPIPEIPEEAQFGLPEDMLPIIGGSK